MKTYRALAYKELLASKITSVLILIAVILSTMMTTAIGQSLGILSAMRDQQAIALNGNRYATFVQMDQAQVDKIRADPRISYAGVSVSVGTVELNRILTLGLNEYWGDSLSAYPSLSQVEEGRLPERPMEIALPEDVLQMLGFSGDVGDTISLAASKALRHGVQTSDFSYTGQFTLTGILRSNYLGYSAGVVQGIVGKGTAEALLPPDYLYYNVDIRTKEKAAFQETMDDLVETLKVPELDTLYNVTYLNAKGISFDEESADTEEDGDGFSLLAVAGLLVGGLILLAAGLVIYNILNISVSRRTEQYGTLRAIGGEKRQMYTVVSLEILLLCGVGVGAPLRHWDFNCRHQSAFSRAVSGPGHSDAAAVDPGEPGRKRSVFVSQRFYYLVLCVCSGHPCGTCRSAGFPGGVNGRTCRCGKAQKSKHQKNSLF